MLLILLALFTHHPIPSSKYIGMFISLLGVTLISWGTGYSGKETISYYGLLLALLSALLWAIYWMIQNKQKDPALINQLCYLAPFLSLFFISVILNEQITLTTYAGLTLIVSGIIFNQYLIPSGKAIRNRMNKVLNEYK